MQIKIRLNLAKFFIIKFISISTADFELIKKGHECKSSHTNLGWINSVQECANRCIRKKGCQFFSFSDFRRSDGLKYCDWEHTANGSCPEGWIQRNYDFYKLKGKSYNAYEYILYATFYHLIP